MWRLQRSPLRPAAYFIEGKEKPGTPTRIACVGMPGLIVTIILYPVSFCQGKSKAIIS